MGEWLTKAMRRCPRWMASCAAKAPEAQSSTPICDRVRPGRWLFIATAGTAAAMANNSFPARSALSMMTPSTWWSRMHLGRAPSSGSGRSTSVWKPADAPCHGRLSAGSFRTRASERHIAELAHRRQGPLADVGKNVGRTMDDAADGADTDTSASGDGPDRDHRHVHHLE